MPEKGQYTEKELGLITCGRTASGRCSICLEKWPSGSKCPKGHQSGFTYFVKEIRTPVRKTRKIRCDASPGNRCSICGTYFDVNDVCDYQHIIGQWYTL